MAFAAKAKEPLNGTLARILPLEMVKKSYPDMAAAERVETNMLDCTNVVLLFLVFLTHKWLNFLGLLSMCNQGCWSQTALAHMGTLCVYTYIYIGMFCTYIHILVSTTKGP